MRGALNKGLIIASLIIFIATVMAVSQPRTGNAQQRGLGETSLLKYDPQQPDNKASKSKPIDRTDKVDHQPATSFAPEDFLKHPGRIHHKQDERSNTRRKKDSVEDISNRQKTRSAGKRKETVKPPRKPAAGHAKNTHIKPKHKSGHKPGHKPHPGQSDRKTKPGEDRPDHLEQVGLAKEKIAEIKAPPKPDKKNATSQMPAVPPGKVQSDKLKGNALPTPSDKNEETASDSRTVRKNRRHDRALKRLMLRPGTAELLASIRQNQDTSWTQARDDSSISDRKGNKYFVKTSDNNKSDYRLIYKEGVRALNTKMRDSLRAHVLKAMQNRPGLKLVIKSYATPADSGQSSDRRIALARALKLREFLIQRGLESNRMNIRALGDSSKTSSADRIDLHIISP